MMTATHKRNKHGRVGVKKYVPNRPLADDQKAEYFERGWRKGMATGVKAAYSEAIRIANGSRNIRDARRKIRELFDGQA